MLIRLLNTALIIALCLSLSSKVLLQDLCDNTKISHKTSQNKTVLSYINANDLADSSDEQDCGCHCHHNHFEFAFLDQSFSGAVTASQSFSLDSSLPLLSQANSPNKPPKIVS